MLSMKTFPRRLRLCRPIRNTNRGSPQPFPRKANKKRRLAKSDNARLDVRLRCMRRSSWLTLPIGLAVVLAFIGDRIVNGRNAEVQHQRLVQELAAIPAPSGAVLKANFDHFSRWNPHKVSVGAAYSTPRSRSDLVAFYEKQLASLGYHYTSTTLNQTIYCKDESSATLRYGDFLTEGWTYTLTLNWGLQCQ
jgi:hypothetical protein